MTLPGIVTLLMLLFPKNAFDPIIVTVKPLVKAGITILPPLPVYPVTVIVPSILVLKLYCACTAVASVKYKNGTNKNAQITRERHREACRGSERPDSCQKEATMRETT